MSTGSRNWRPPCTTRCPTASNVAIAPSARATSAGSSSLFQRSMSCAASTWSRLPSTRSLRLLEPALTTSTRIRPASASARPRPIAHLGHVLAEFVRVLDVSGARVDHLLTDRRNAGSEPGHTIDHVHDKVEAIHVVEHNHVKRRRDGSFFLVAAHMQVIMTVAAVGEAVDQRRVTVIGED